jgi:hypothetical protein
MKRTLVLSAMLVGVLLPSASGRAAAAAPAVCGLTLEVAISPGLSFTPGSATYQGEGGTVACEGAVIGRQMTGAGTLSGAGILGLFTGAVCAQGVGGGTFSLTIPTSEGQVEVTSDSTFNWAGPAGELSGKGLSATFELTPLDGDCVSAPVTRAVIHMRGILGP